MDARSKPQVIDVAQESLPGTLYGCRWIPNSARIVVFGGKATGEGLIQVYTFEGTTLELASSSQAGHTFRSGTFGASPNEPRTLVTGSTNGDIQLWDVSQGLKNDYCCKAHTGMINSVAGCGAEGHGLANLATGGADGTVKIWDSRQMASTVACFLPGGRSKLTETSSLPPASLECWTVAFGNAHSESTDYCLLAGYSDGALRLFDLRMGTERWQASLGSGVVSAGFDRIDIKMNKFVAACMDSSLHTFDARTQHSNLGFAGSRELVPGDSALWGCAHLPQHREVNVVYGGDGHLRLYKYHYPDRRRVMDSATKEAKGVAGSLQCLTEKPLSEQPISGFDWHPDKSGLFSCTALDQCLRVGLVTKLHLQ